MSTGFRFIIRYEFFTATYVVRNSYKKSQMFINTETQKCNEVNL